MPSSPSVSTVPPDPRLEIAALIAVTLGLFAVLKLGLLSALLAGLLVYLLCQSAAPAFRHVGVAHRTGKALVLVMVAGLIGLGLVYGALEALALLITGSDSLVALLRKMADVVGDARGSLPAWAQAYIPASTQELQTEAAAWLRDHAGQLGVIGQDFGKFVFRALLGMIIGGLIALNRDPGAREVKPLVRAFTDRFSLLAGAFRNVVFSQIRISALNTTITAIYLAAILPSLGVELPLVKTMIVVTFVAGLLPILGNLISNTVIVVVSFSVSPVVAAGSLVFLVVIHKLEYFVNARIIGSQIRARAWELLSAMLVMEAAFGIPGLAAAPIFYAYFKDELSARRLI